MYGLSDEAFRALPVQTRFLLAASDCAGYRHPWVKKPAEKVRFPRQVGSIPSFLIDPSHHWIDCSSLNTYCTMASYPWVPWTEEDYADFQVFSDRVDGKAGAPRPFCPIEAIERVGIGTRLDGDPVSLLDVGPLQSAPVVIMQGWRKRFSSGHAQAGIVTPQGIRIIESTNIGHDGVQTYALKTWEAIVAYFKEGVIAAVLH